MRALRIVWVLGIVLLGNAWADAAWRVGIARSDITPTSSIWMAGYASRTHPSEGVLHPLWAKALAIEDQAGSRVVLVTTDLIGLSRPISDAVAARVQKQTGLPRERLLLNSSHTHSGPVVGDVARIAHHTGPKDDEVAAAYAKDLEGKLAAVVEAAIKALRPAKLAYAEGEATFGMNRRAARNKGYAIGPNPKGPVDHSVPVLAVRDEQDRLVAVLVGYACHNTTLAIYQINGDYAGFAQIALEKAHPGATALFMIGCGADTNPEPRGKVELAEQHGRSLAAAVDQALAKKPCPVEGRLTAAFGRVDLPLADLPSKEELQRRLAGDNVYQKRLAQSLLERMEKGQPIPMSYPCPVQVVKLGNDVAMIALGGEVVVDYALRLRKEFPGRRLWIAGYSNEVFAYVPSERVRSEGGYEAGDSAVYFGLHGPFKPGLEDRIVGEVKKLMQATQD